MDRILLTGIQVFAYGGVTADERRIGQRYRLDIELWLDLRRAAESDNLDYTVSYAEVHDLAVSELRKEPFHLVEAAAYKVATAILDRFPVQGATVRVTKLLPPVDGVMDEASVELSVDRAGANVKDRGRSNS